MDRLPAEVWLQLDSAIAHVTAVPAAFCPTTAVEPTAEEESPLPASDCSSEYDTAWMAAANLTQLEAAAAAAAVGVVAAPAASAAPAPAPPTPTADPSSDDALAAALDTIATQDVVLATPRTTTAAAAAATTVAATAMPLPERPRFPFVGDMDDAAAGTPPIMEKVRVKRLFVPDTDEDTWDTHAAAQPLSGDTLVIPETPAFTGNAASAAAGETDRGGGTTARRGNTVRIHAALV